jgi:hypothetical protein
MPKIGRFPPFGKRFFKRVPVAWDTSRWIPRNWVESASFTQRVAARLNEVRRGWPCDHSSKLLEWKMVTLP